jgi:hypothetical protein
MDNIIIPNAEIDESPLSASSMERRNSLEKHLQTRPDPQDLKERHILLDTTVAPSLQAARAELARQRTTDSLKKHLEHRPDRDELVERVYSFFFSSSAEIHRNDMHN